nr:MAG TPA: hypothetical protein [Caudoviricetes sp.]
MKNQRLPLEMQNLPLYAHFKIAYMIYPKNH